MPVQFFSIKKKLTQLKQVLILANRTIFFLYRNYVILTAATTKTVMEMMENFAMEFVFTDPCFFHIATSAISTSGKN